MLTTGQQVISQGGQRGVIGAVTDACAERTFAISGGGLERVRQTVEVIFDKGVEKLPDSIVALWASRAEGLPLIPEAEIAERRAAAKAATEQRLCEARQRRDREAETRAAFMVEARARMPADAKAVIIAEMVKDQSDSMTDYYGSTTERTLILAWSTHTRDLFPELRKAALNNAATADLFDAPESAEHREKYSMGGGYYLKANFRHSNGWRVSKQKLWQGVDSVPTGEWSLTAPVVSTAGATITEHFHTKHGFTMWVVELGDRVERDEFERLRDLAKAAGGWWSRAWGSSPSGFAFKSLAAAEAFAAGAAPAVESSTIAAPAERALAPANSGLASKFRDMADKLQAEIDDKFADRRSNTPKQQRQAASARLDGYRLQRTQAALRALADHHDAGTVPTELRGVTTKGEVFGLARGEIDHSGGYYDAGHETGQPGDKSPAAAALWAMIASVGQADRAKHALREKVDSLKFAKIPGYFPTPAAIVAQMIERARLPEAGRILEPSAGSGAILDQAREAAPGCELLAFERHASLREILTLKGHTLTGSDFMEATPHLQADRVLMNPPFENGQDIDHVRRAFAHVAAGGRLVAIMSPGPFFRSDRKSQDFRAWFEDHGGEREELPAGAFKDSGTGVATVLVTIDRD